MSSTSVIVEGVLAADGSLQLESSPPLPPGPVRVILQSLPAQVEEELDWADLEYDPVPLKELGKVLVRIEQRGNLKPMPHDLDEE